MELEDLPLSLQMRMKGTTPVQVQMQAQLQVQTPMKTEIEQYSRTKSGDASDQCVQIENTLILLDYDDTLLPTQWLRELCAQADAQAQAEAGADADAHNDIDENGILDLSASSASAFASSASTCTPLPVRCTLSQKMELEVLENELVALLDSLQAAGTLAIVTNATAEYVEATATEFLPRVKQWLDAHGVCVFSARDAYEAQFPDAVHAWKLHAFQDVVRAWCCVHGGETPAHVVSVGDSILEQWAACALLSRPSVGVVKTVKLRDLPSCTDLQVQAALLRCALATIVEAPTSSNFIVASC